MEDVIMISLLVDAISTDLIYIISNLKDQRIKTNNAFFLFLVVAGIGCLLHSQAHALLFDKDFMETVFLEV